MKEISRRVLSRTNALSLLDGLAQAPGDIARSLYLPPGPSPAEIETERPGQEVPAEVMALAARSKTGAIFFLSSVKGCLFIPPFPVAEKYASDGPAIEPLQSLLQNNYKMALVLVRLGSYAIGVFNGEKLESSKVGTGLVHGRHRQGGSSAHRFERHRDKQIEYFLTRVCHHAREHLEPRARALDYLVYGGARTTIRLLQKQCPFLSRLGTPVLPPLLDIPEPRQTVLETAVKRVCSSTVITWREG
jgi:hypothetical protein